MERGERGLDHSVLSNMQRWAASPAQGSYFLASDFVPSLVIAVSWAGRGQEGLGEGPGLSEVERRQERQMSPWHSCLEVLVRRFLVSISGS